MTNEDKKISGIYQQANAVEPPVQLDDSILAASRSAVEHTPRAKSPFSGSWPVPVAMAAVVIVAVIIVPLVTQEAKQDKPLPARMTADQPATAPAQRPGKDQASPSMLMKPPPAFKQSSKMDDQLMEEEVILQAPAASEPPASLYEMDSSGSTSTVGRTVKQNKPAEILLERKAISAQSLKKKERARDLRTPDEWLAYINELVAANDIEKAKIEIKAFKNVYPDHPVDPDLNELLD